MASGTILLLMAPQRHQASNFLVDYIVHLLLLFMSLRVDWALQEELPTSLARPKQPWHRKAINQSHQWLEMVNQAFLSTGICHDDDDDHDDVL